MSNRFRKSPAVSVWRSTTYRYGCLVAEISQTGLTSLTKLPPITSEIQIWNLIKHRSEIIRRETLPLRFVFLQHESLWNKCVLPGKLQHLHAVRICCVQGRSERGGVGGCVTPPIIWASRQSRHIIPIRPYESAKLKNWIKTMYYDDNNYIVYNFE